MGYCTESDLELRSPTPTPAQQSTAIEVASDLIDKMTHDHFANYPATVKLFSGAGRRYLLTTPYLRALTSVEIFDPYTSVWETVLMKDVKYNCNYVMCLRRRFPLGNSNVQLTGDWGWVVVPSLIKLVCAQLASEILSKGATSESLSSESLGKYSYSKRGVDNVMIPTQLRSQLSSYDLHPIMGGRVISLLESLDEREIREWPDLLV